MVRDGSSQQQPVRSRVSGAAYGALLRLWRVLPLPSWLRAQVLWWGNQHYLVAVAALIWDDAGRILLGRHSYLPAPGWSLPGGTIQGVESLDAALRRELAEELGFAVEVGPPVAWTTLPAPRRVVVAFTCYRGPGAFRPNAEIVEIAYFPPQEALRLVRRDARELLRIAMQRRAEPGRAAPG